METLIDKSSSYPLYQQIKQMIVANIEADAWPAGSKIPSENELVKQLGVSRMTVNRGLRELSRDGVLQRVHGLGTYVAEKPRHASLIHLQDIAEEVRGQGRQYTTEVLAHNEIAADAETARRMECEPGSSLYYLEAVHFQDQLPIQLESRYVSKQMIPGFLAVDFSRQTSTHYLLQQFAPQQMEHIVQAILPDQKTAKVLKIEPDQPCLQLLRRTWKSGQIVTAACMIYPGNRYDLSARYQTTDYPQPRVTS